MLELWKNVDTTRKIVGSRRTPKSGSKGKQRSKSADAHNLDSKPSIVEPEVEIDEFNMTYLNVDALQESEKMRGSEWIKVGVDTGAGKTAWPQSITYGWQMSACCGLRRLGSNLRVRGIQAPVYKPLLSVGEYTTMGGVTVLYGDKGYMFHKGSNVAKKIDAWIQKELKDSQYRGCTVAYRKQRVQHLHETKRK